MGQVFLTIVSGVSVFVLGQIILKLVIDPVHDLKRHIAKIAHCLNHNAPHYTNPSLSEKEKLIEISNEIRLLSSDLIAKLYLIPAYKQVYKLFGLPTFENVDKADGLLISLSNLITNKSPVTDNYKIALSILDALNIYVSDRDRI